MEVVDVDAADEAELPLLEGLEELPFDETNADYYMGGVGNGLGLQQEHLQVLAAMDEEDEPDLGDDNDVDAGPHVLIPAFSDEEDSDDGHDAW
ncbi:hypothetical protein PAXINDRAFT_14874 [Paxillus involutus ATCC 200175]|uniref:Unplaced genomic scaffold PAXINscaffold_44, whole genome shotgun sequence n=1 Tax=Paxillus involutus ATCC 200175 TaxID=664439 RepID=A0A0C9T9E8_PAXIN|nr:hypothetical protein PAXINDRAFT_14874 [Paxillus involutus ATCC 200175]